MIELLRAYGIVVEEGSLNRAAERLHISQPSLTRQMQSLEREIGGSLLERQPSGVKPTTLGQATLLAARPLLDQYDAVCADLRRQARGQRAELRIGYIGSAAQTYLNPALTALRREHPEAKVKLLDLTPGEQIAALKKGDIDLALIDPAAHWDLLLLWQRGRAPQVLKAMVNFLAATAREKGAG